MEVGEAQLDYPSGHGLARVYPQQVERDAATQAQIDALNPKKAAAVEPKTAIAKTPNESWDADAI